MNHRGCGGTRLTSGWAYNGAFTGDVRMAVSHIRERYLALYKQNGRGGGACHTSGIDNKPK